MNYRIWYAADALMADLTVRHHHVRAVAEEQVEERMRRRYPDALAILVRREESWRQALAHPSSTP